MKLHPTKAFIKLIPNQYSIFGELNRDRVAVAGPANYATSFLDLLKDSLDFLGVSGTGGATTVSMDFTTGNLTTTVNGVQSAPITLPGAAETITSLVKSLQVNGATIAGNANEVVLTHVDESGTPTTSTFKYSMEKISDTVYRMTLDDNPIAEITIPTYTITHNVVGESLRLELNGTGTAPDTVVQIDTDGNLEFEATGLHPLLKFKGTSLTQADVLSYFSGINGIDFNSTTGEVSGAVDPNTLNDLTVSADGFFVDVSQSPVIDTNNVLGGGIGSTVTLQDIVNFITPSEHPPVSVGTTLPTTVGGVGAEFILVNSNGVPISTYVSNGTTWEILTFAKEKIEIPNTAFLDSTNPKISEVRTWIDATLTDLQKVNSQLVLGDNLENPDFIWSVITNDITQIKPQIQKEEYVHSQLTDSEFIESFARPIYRLLDDYNQNVDGNRLIITTVDAANKRFRCNRPASSMRLEKSVAGERWTYMNSFPTNSSIASKRGYIEYVDYENDWIYYDDYIGGDPTAGLESELLNPYTNWSVVGDNLLFPQLIQGASFNGKVMQNHHMGGVLKKNDGTFLATVWTRYTDSSFQSWLATSNDGENWTLGATPFIGNSDIAGGTILFVTALHEIPKNSTHAGKYLCLLRMSSTSTRLPGYVVLNEDLTFATTPKLMTFDASNTLGLTNLGNCTLTYFRGKHRICGLDVSSPLNTRRNLDIVLGSGDLFDFLDGTTAPESFNVIDTQDQDISNDWDHGIKNYMSYYNEGDDLYMLATNTSYGQNTSNRNYGIEIVYKLNTNNNEWIINKNPIWSAFNDYRSSDDSTYILRDNGSTVSYPYKVGDQLYMMSVLKRQSTDGYSIFLLKYQRNYDGTKKSKFNCGIETIDTASKVIYFDTPFDYTPVVIPTPISTTSVNCVISDVDKYKFTVRLFDSSGVTTTGVINYIAKSV